MFIRHRNLYINKYIIFIIPKCSRILTHEEFKLLSGIFSLAHQSTEQKPDLRELSNRMTRWGAISVA